MKKVKSFFNPTTIVCLLLGACLAVLLAIFVSKDKSITTPIVQKETESQTVDDILVDADSDMTDVIGYDLYGTHTIKDSDNTITFKDDNTASGYAGKAMPDAKNVHWSVSMDEGVLHLNFTDTNNAVQYVFSYDDDMNIVLSSEDETLTLVKQ